MRRALRILRRVIVALLGSFAVAFITLAVFLQTDCGQERVRRWAEARLDSAVQGDASIARAHLTLGGTLELEGVVIRDPHGAPLAAADSVAVEFAWRPLLSKRFRASTVAVDGLEVHAAVSDDGTLDVATMFQTDDEATVWAATVGELRVTRGLVSLRHPSLPTITLANLEVTGRLETSPDGFEIVVGHLAAQWQEESISVAGKANVRLRGSTYSARLVEARVGEAEIASPWILADEESGLLAGLVSVRASAKDLHRLPVPALQSHWLGDVDLSAVVFCRDRTQLCSVGSSGHVEGGTASFAGRIGRDLSSVEGRAEIGHLVPERVIRGAPAGRVAELTIEGNVSGSSLDDLRGVVDGNGSGAIEETRVDALRFHVDRGEDGRFRGSADATTELGQGNAKAEVRRDDEGRWVVEQSKASAEIPSLVPLLRERADVTGRAEVTLSATGDVDSLEVHGAADVWRVASGSVRVGHLYVEAASEGVSALERPQTLSGTLSLIARGTRIESHRIGNLTAGGRFADFGRRMTLQARGKRLAIADSARSRVTARIEGEHLTLLFTKTKLTAEGLAWKGKGGKVTVDAERRVVIRDLDLASGDSRVQASGVIDPPRARRAGSRFDVKVKKLDLARVSPTVKRLAGTDAPLTGTLRLDATIARRDRELTIDGEGNVRGLSWRAGAQPVDVVAEIHTAPGRFSGSGTVTLRRRGGSAELEADLDGPRELLDRAAWRRISMDDVRKAKLKLHDVSIAAASNLLSLEAPVRSGRVDGEVEFPAEGRKTRVDLGVEGVEVEGIDRLGAHISGLWDDRAFSGKARVGQRGKTLLDGRFTVKTGVSDLWARTPAELRKAELSASAPLTGFELARIHDEGLVSEPLDGKLSGTVVVSGTLGNPIVELRKGRTKKMTAAGIPFERVSVKARTDGSAVTVTLQARQKGGGRVRGKGTYGWRPRARFSARLTFERFDIDVLRRYRERDSDLWSDIDGKLDANVRLFGWPDAPALNGWANVTKGQLLLEDGARLMTNATLRMRFAGDVVHVEHLEARSGAGRISAKGELALVRLSPGKFSFDVETHGFPMTVGETEAAADLVGNLTGKLANRRIRATAKVRGGTIRLSRATRELQSLRPLEDVVFVDRAASAAQAGPGSSPTHELRVRVPRGVNVRSDELNAVMTADLRLRFTDGRVSWLAGTIEVVRGTYELLDRRYRIRRARAELEGPMPPDPSLDILLWRQFPSTGVTVRVTGSFNEPKPVLGSDSGNYDDTQVLIIMLGEDPDDPEIANRPIEDQAWGAAGVLLSRKVKKRLRVVDVLRTGSNSVELGRWVTDDLLIGYRERFSSDERENSREFTFEYRILRRLIAEGRYGSNITGGDLLWVFRW